MPKGSPPSQSLLPRYNKKLKENNEEFAKSIRFRRKAISLLLGEDAAKEWAEEKKAGQRTVSRKYHDNEQYIRKAEKTMRKGYKY
jgi:hypothetical protein